MSRHSSLKRYIELTGSMADMSASHPYCEELIEFWNESEE